MKNLKKFAFGLLVAVLAFGFSAFTTQQSKNQTVWHIQDTDMNGNYVVSEDGFCGSEPVEPCQFTTDLAPDQPDGTYSPSYLQSNNVDIVDGERL